jgi:hypothetical protein
MKLEFIPLFQKEIAIYPLLSLPSCISQASYIVFLFKQKLFHISLRALTRKDCSNYENLFYGITNHFNLPVTRSGDQVTFYIQTKAVRLIGTKNPRGAILDIVRPGICGSDGDQAVP